jgi:hypothetical protein
MRALAEFGQGKHRSGDVAEELGVKTVNRRPILALTQFWCSLTSGRSANQPSLKQIDLGPSIHLPFDQLEFRDLPFGLAVGPR